MLQTYLSESVMYSVDVCRCVQWRRIVVFRELDDGAERCTSEGPHRDVLGSCSRPTRTSRGTDLQSKQIRCAHHP